ncbi:TerC family protein [Engelhardtia mirabilis]|uniref:Integral membrane protein TerC family protein n=1 Tax=Engelhardtia mirabilis TaxID=2528011 RepID=A0A518BF24_9BACT|nr:Integral membrane protein TerC family protein [Planctomycetes bacterium Pla133]QDU99819.1 Integral membrane protein TerC family protein [Planctomycetes bacterium Pla86]
MEIWLEPASWIALATLTAVEIVLGIDNVVFIAILADRLPEGERDKARKLGLLAAMVTRIALLLSISWLVQLTAPLFGVFGHDFSGRDLILLLGGLFLMGKATLELHHMTVDGGQAAPEVKVATMTGVITQILALDVVFSLDSVITAVGLADHVIIMVLAVVISVGVMIVSAGAISSFLKQQPTFKTLALSFLLMIGTLLVADGFGLHVPKGYVYFAMAFSAFVEFMNYRLRRKRGTATG